MNPYEALPDAAFWRSAVATKSMFDLSDLWHPKFILNRDDPVSTFGSCFAQHIGRALEQKKYNWLIAERPPESLSTENALKYNYNVFSSRTGNIYTTSLLKQWVEWAAGAKTVPTEVWHESGAFYDPFRPRVEPGGFRSKEELIRSRERAIEAFYHCILTSKVFVFTLGLTESWFNAEDGYEYPMCPGTAAGEYSKKMHKFNNQTFSEVSRNLRDAINLMRKINPSLKFILTVSPVPLTATNSGRNVLVATMESKSILRAVSGELASNRGYVDYFPSYEIINSPVFKGVFFEPNMRSVNPYGVNFVMTHFFRGFENAGLEDVVPYSEAGSVTDVVSDATCEEELLSAFGK